MSNFITSADYKAYITDDRLAQIIEADTNRLDEAELTAIAVVKDALHQWHDTDAIFSTSGSNRPRQVVRWCVCLALYYLYERVPDKLVPERVVKNYEDANDTLLAIEDGKKAVDLPKRVDDDGENVNKFRWGSQPPRGHMS
jgi:phage gp36-like protein